MLTAPLYEKLVLTNTKLSATLGLTGAKDVRHVICQGGGDSAKTISIIQYMCMCANIEDNTKQLIAADTMPNLKDGALYAYEKFVEPDFSHYISDFNKTDKLITFKNKSKIKLKSFDNERTARGSLWDRIFLNEGNLFGYDLFWQLQRKTRKQTIIDFNPTAAFWVHDRIIKEGEKQFRGKWKRFIVDHRHNPFLTKEEHDEYESISDPELFDVYARGLTGKIKGLICGHFKQIERMPDCDRYVWGIDYGYTNDPTAIVKIGIKGRARYMLECCYTAGLSAQHIKQIFINNGWNHSQPIYSEHDAEMILQLRKLGMPVSQAKKGPGSLVAGLAKLREYECYYIGANFHTEVITYKYITAKDLLTGKEILTNEPMDGSDHLISAGRYGVYTDSFVNRNG